MTKLSLILLSLILTSCLSSRYPTSTKEYWGVVMTCTTDSTTLTVDSIIKIKKGVTIRPAYCPSCKYYGCDNKPEYFDFVFFWPVEISLSFEKNEYSFMHSPRPSNPDIKYGDKGFSVTYDFDMGTLNHNKKDNTWVLKSKKYNWTRSFTLSYSKQDSVLTLRSKNGH